MIGPVAQSGLERLPCKEEASGSNPDGSIFLIERKHVPVIQMVIRTFNDLREQKLSEVWLNMRRLTPLILILMNHM